MIQADQIEVNPNVMLGKPVIRGTRVPVELVLRKLSEGATEAELLDGYPRLTPEDLRAIQRASGHKLVRLPTVRLKPRKRPVASS